MIFKLLKTYVSENISFFFRGLKGSMKEVLQFQLFQADVLENLFLQRLKWSLKDVLSFLPFKKPAFRSNFSPSRFKSQ